MKLIGTALALLAVGHAGAGELPPESSDVARDLLLMMAYKCERVDAVRDLEIGTVLVFCDGGSHRYVIGYFADHGHPVITQLVVK
jgi:hypothetical protein